DAAGRVTVTDLRPPAAEAEPATGPESARPDPARAAAEPRPRVRQPDTSVEQPVRPRPAEPDTDVTPEPTAPPARPDGGPDDYDALLRDRAAL
ncbi:hypothetical protein IU502_29585, partial [Nocardia cyriacigeorgica]|nr:hypothetical protein [Nocardia cyriacigeorgica]